MNLRLADYCGMCLAEHATSRPEVWALDGDLADSDGALHFAKRHPERFLMAGIAEQSMVSIAAGMAACGLRPWVFSFAAFLCYRAFDQIRVCISQARQPVVLVGSQSGGCSGRNGKTHAALNDLALMLSLPNLDVWCPADQDDVRLCVDQVLQKGAAAYIRLPRRTVRAISGDTAPARWIGARSPSVIVSTGLATHLALAVQTQLAGRGLPLGLLHVNRLSPFPQEVTEALESAETVFVLEDHSRFGGLASLLHQHVAVSVQHLGWPMGWAGESGHDEEILFAQGLHPVIVSQRIEEALNGKHRLKH
jgi:transketolase